MNNKNPYSADLRPLDSEEIKSPGQKRIRIGWTLAAFIPVWIGLSLVLILVASIAGADPSAPWLEFLNSYLFPVLSIGLSALLTRR